MNTVAARSAGRRRGAIRQWGINTVYVTTGGLLLSVPTAGGFTVASLITSTVMLTTTETGLSPDEIAIARTSLILFTCVIGLATLVLCFFLGRLHRSRAAALLGAHMPRPMRSRRGWRRLLNLGITRFGLRQLTYHFVGLVWGPLQVSVVLACLVAGPTLVAFAFTLSDNLLIMSILYICSGVALVITSPWIIRALSSVDLSFLRWVNGVTEKAILTQRVQQVTEARSAAVAAADAERRRIERNLHDGAQQRLTALAVNLGIERSRHSQAAATGKTVDTQHTKEALQYAMTEVQTALQEIRQLVRGLQPAVLEDRGLDAAISGIASRAALPVAVKIEIDERPALAIETVAYFVVSEAVNNIIAHSQAEQASVTVRGNGDSLEVIIADDGIGGANEHRGTGLTGLRQRVESVDGTLDISSSVSEGTMIRVELPCE